MQKLMLLILFPKDPCAQIAHTLAPKYPNRDYFKAKVYTIWVHGPLYPIKPLKEPLQESVKEPLKE